MSSKSLARITSGQAPVSRPGVALVGLGAGTLAVPLIAAILPFGVLFWAIALIVAGIVVL